MKKTAKEVNATDATTRSAASGAPLGGNAKSGNQAGSGGGAGGGRRGESGRGGTEATEGAGRDGRRSTGDGSTHEQNCGGSKGVRVWERNDDGGGGGDRAGKPKGDRGAALRTSTNTS